MLSNVNDAAADAPRRVSVKRAISGKAVCKRPKREIASECSITNTSPSVRTGTIEALLETIWT